MCEAYTLAMLNKARPNEFNELAHEMRHNDSVEFPTNSRSHHRSGIKCSQNQLYTYKNNHILFLPPPLDSNVKNKINFLIGYKFCSLLNPDGSPHISS